MKALVCILLLLETFVFVVQQQVDGGLNEKEIGQQISSEGGRQNQPQTDTLRDEASTDSKQNYNMGIPDIYTALRELAAIVTEQKANIRALQTQLREQQTFILEEMNKKNEEMSNLTLSQVEELKKENRDREIAFSAGLIQHGYRNIGPYTTDFTLTYKKVFTNIGDAYSPFTGFFTAPLKGAYMFRISIHGPGGIPANVSIYKNGEHMVTARDVQAQEQLNASNGVVLILEVGDVVYVRLGFGTRISDSYENSYNTFSGFLLFPLS
ncbi:heavy metal-binding protein HIP-like isoform X1 [Megalobrama amblycephala]|uniref:heavy metal-binding protein HIP-like isoform X1 n=1 Tax=Megalobrama amblycephala TaxID=75352 RepID=UPI0020142AFF|nr:heavy metal-binding protein HIP-like isoform X1 [Megalobrama amblycephala]